MKTIKMLFMMAWLLAVAAAVSCVIAFLVWSLFHVTGWR